MTKDKTRVALVTGGMGGLGEAICLKLEALGYTVVTTYSPGNTKAAEWQSAMKAQGHHFHAYPCDVADWEIISRFRGGIAPLAISITGGQLDSPNFCRCQPAPHGSCWKPFVFVQRTFRRSRRIALAHNARTSAAADESRRRRSGCGDLHEYCY